ncbi:MAG: hypothetical protein CMJ13_08440 [Pelagibacterales bacterium]|nr:hypothetical protein [Pelagibacterales bacterium]
MEVLNNIKSLKIKNIPDLEGWIGDAKFGINQLSQYFHKKNKFEILEIGCGIGLLLASLKEKFPSLSVEGIEPYKGGFGRLKIAKKIIPKNININYLNFENFNPKKKYDIIYSVNVFEHLLDWKLYLKKTEEWLKPGGINIILCPNYSFPYESHFNIPVILNKRITYFFFKNKINKFERKNKALGLWKSLNFIKMRNVRKYCENNDLNFKYCNQIFTDMVRRLDEDLEFKKRQNFIGACAKKLKSIGFINLLNNNIFYSLHPYMKIEITKKKTNEKN